MGPNWWLKRALEQVYQDGVRNINVVFIFRHVTLPVVCCLLLAVSFPYVTAAGVIPIFVRSPDTRLFCLRRIYPFLLAMFILIAGFIFQGRQFRLLYERIRNDKYLVGQKLVNYEHGKRPTKVPTKAMADTGWIIHLLEVFTVRTESRIAPIRQQSHNTGYFISIA